ncbi:exported hypothetical protein [Candidatus Desulfarcum epimagneticum]|uniref:Uncharacterized protein n=1 Tax=uncultured Desulfobacteraceae bacterium TaxID=218296 RepID=A0A484HKP6_9BACT|nr:exported hypothetical protein [uncultured Desulfobacteraceae bacterium]
MKKHLVLIALAAILSGCGAVSLKSVPYGEGVAKGAAYATPMKVIAIEVDYVKQVKSRKVFGYTVENEGRLPRVIAVSASLSEEIRPDPRNIFLVNVDDIAEAGTFSASMDYKFTDLGLLSSVDSQISDKKKEIVEKTIGASLSLAKIVAIAQKDRAGIEALPPYIRPMARRIMDIYEKLGKADEELASPETKEKKKAQEGAKIRSKLLTELKKLHKEIGFYIENNREVTVTSEPKSARFVLPYDLSGFKGPKKDPAAGGEYYEMAFSLGGLVQEVTDVFAPRIKARLYISKEEKAMAAARLESRTDGLVHRLPISARLVVRVENPGLGKFNSIDKYVSMPQLSRFFAMPLKSKRFGKRKTKLKFSAATGGLIHFGAATDSSYENMAESLDQAAGDIRSDLSDIATAKDDWAKESMLSQKYRVSAEKSYLKTLVEIEALRKEIERIKSGAPAVDEP